MVRDCIKSTTQHPPPTTYPTAIKEKQVSLGSQYVVGLIEKGSA